MLLLASAVVAGAALFRDDDASDDRRAAVAAYIVQVNTTQQALVLELEQVNIAYRELRLKATPVPRQRQRVEAAERSLAELRSRFARLRVPAEAARLHKLLLGLVDLQVAFAHEIAGLVGYLPLQAEESRTVAAATERLRVRLAAGASSPAQRAAFETYRQVVAAVVRRLERAAAPAVLEPSRVGEIERLQRLETLAAQVGRALEAQNEGEVDRLFAAFVRASGATGTTPAERQAVIVYNRRLAAITDRRTAVNAERVRLDSLLR